AGVHLSFLAHQSSDGAGVGDRRGGLLCRPLQFVDAVAAALYAVDRTLRGGSELDRLRIASLSSGHGTGAVGGAHLLVLGDADLYRRAGVSAVGTVRSAAESAGFRGARLSRPIALLPCPKL